MGEYRTKIDGLEVLQCWKTSDGEMFEQEDEAKTHQVRYNFCERLQEWLDDSEDVSRDDMAVTVDTIMGDLDGVAKIFELYIKERAM